MTRFCMGPVSYTHLDVYKRQPLRGRNADLYGRHSEKQREGEWMSGAISVFLDGVGAFFLIYLLIYASYLFLSVSVDVYKRQGAAR